jgi:hypothetical protein
MWNTYASVIFIPLGGPKARDWLRRNDRVVSDGRVYIELRKGRQPVSGALVGEIGVRPWQKRLYLCDEDERVERQACGIRRRLWAW